MQCFVYRGVVMVQKHCSSCHITGLQQFGSFQEDTLVNFLVDPSHFGAHVAYQEEANGGDAHCHFSYPESHVPAVSFGNGAEGKTCHKSPHCNTRECV